MDSGDATGKILITLTSDNKTGVLDHVSELGLTRKPLDTLHKILVAIAVSRHELTNQGDPLKRPLLVDGVKDGMLINL